LYGLRNTPLLRSSPSGRRIKLISKAARPVRQTTGDAAA